MGKLFIPGVGEIDVDPLTEKQLLIKLLRQNGEILKATNSIGRLIDLWIQVDIRLRLGWTIEDIVKDLELTVPLPKKVKDERPTIRG